jgi:hypothetical protein
VVVDGVRVVGAEQHIAVQAVDAAAIAHQAIVDVLAVLQLLDSRPQIVVHSSNLHRLSPEGGAL